MSLESLSALSDDPVLRLSAYFAHSAGRFGPFRHL
jgi:hypothetical protein